MKSNSRYVMINHVLNRRKKHLNDLKKKDESEEMIKTWEKFYKKMLNKYGIKDVNEYVNQ